MVGFNKTPKFKQGKKSMTPKKFQTDDGEMNMDVDKASSMKKKGFNSSFQTPGMKNMSKAMRVSFQLPESPSKSAAKAKHPTTPMPKRKTMTPVSVKMEKSNVEFQGMNTPGKQQFGSGKKGGKGQSYVMQQLLNESKDEDEDDDDDEDDDFAPQNEADIDDEDDDDDDDDEDDDDEDESDDLDSEEEAEIKKKLIALKQKQMAEKKPQNQKAVPKQNEALSAKQNKSLDAKKASEGSNAQGKKNLAKLTSELENESEDDEDDDDEEDDEDDEDEEDTDSEDDAEISKKLIAMQNKQKTETTQQKAGLKNKAAAAAQNKTPVKTNAVKKETGSPVKKTPQVKQEKSPAVVQNVPKEVITMDAERKRERDSRNLFIRGLPSDVTVEELKALSPDITGVNIPQRKAWRAKITRVFAFLEFTSEKKADENYVALQTKKLRGQPLYVDYSGEKSKRFKELHKDVDQKVYDRKKLFVSGLPCDATIDQVAQMFPKATSVSLNISPEFRNASVVFLTKEDTEEALKKNEKPKINGKVITVLYALEKSSRKQKRKAKSSPKKANPAAKRFKPDETAKIVPKQESEEEEDDDDDDDDDDDEDSDE